MPRTIRARFCDGVLQPLEALDLLEGSEVTVSIEEIRRPPHTSEDSEAFKVVAGAWRGSPAAEQLKQTIQARRQMGDRPDSQP